MIPKKTWSHRSKVFCGSLGKEESERVYSCRSAWLLLCQCATLCLQSETDLEMKHEKNKPCFIATIVLIPSGCLQSFKDNWRGVTRWMLLFMWCERRDRSSLETNIQRILLSINSGVICWCCTEQRCPSNRSFFIVMPAARENIQIIFLEIEAAAVWKTVHYTICFLLIAHHHSHCCD